MIATVEGPPCDHHLLFCGTRYSIVSIERVHDVYIAEWREVSKFVQDSLLPVLMLFKGTKLYHDNE